MLMTLLMSLNAKAQFVEMFNMIMNTMEENMTAISAFIPGSSNNNFGAYISLTHPMGAGLIKIEKITPDGSKYQINIDQCQVFQGNILIPACFEPESSIKITKKSNGKVLYTDKIPSKSSSDYESFCNKTENNAIIIMTVLSGGEVNYFNSNSTRVPPSSNNNGIICRSCHGTGKCGTCNGTGYFRNIYTGESMPCHNCSESNGRICTVCNGTGHW